MKAKIHPFFPVLHGTRGFAKIYPFLHVLRPAHIEETDEISQQRSTRNIINTLQTVQRNIKIRYGERQKNVFVTKEGKKNPIEVTFSESTNIQIVL